MTKNNMALEKLMNWNEDKMNENTSDDEIGNNKDNLRLVTVVQNEYDTQMVDMADMNLLLPDFVMSSEFNLNRERAIKKKIKPASRPFVDQKITGGGHVTEFSSGAYKLVKPAIFKMTPMWSVKLDKKLMKPKQLW